MSVFSRILRAGEGKKVKRLASVAAITSGLEEVFRGFSDDELRAMTDDFRARIEAGETLDTLMPEAFATVREVARRVLGQRPFDVQVMGGAALHMGMVAEMKTGEGKTLAATMPAYLNALTGKGVHIVTVNDYLAKYQSELMGRVFRFLGLETGCILAGMPQEERRKQYLADITYGTNNEFGFDHLRDNMVLRPEDVVHRELHFAIIDECDSILIDEARTPLLISGPASGDNSRWYGEFARLVRSLNKDVDYEVDEKKRAVGVLEPGIDKVEQALGIDNLYSAQNTPLIGFLNNAIKAKELFVRDRDYVVQGGDLDIIDEHTGRIFKGRRFGEGLHQALEAKEGLPIKAEVQTFATITLQNFFRKYEKVAGMTGTAQTEAAELRSTYGMEVVSVPTHMPMIRIDQSDLLYKNSKAKFEAIVEDIKERHEKGQPVLVGTISVEKSEFLSRELDKVGIPHSVLNAKQHAREATIIAEAGRKGVVTIATNMAGRGTDIMLGGNPEFRAVEALAEKGLDPIGDAAKYEKEWAKAFEAAQRAVQKEHDEVVAAGGLYVLGTERHESRRIDNQLRGRSGRQGDPGESRFYLSLEDDLMRIFQSGLAAQLMNSTAFPDDMPIESKVLTRGVRSAQAQIEGHNHEIRKTLLKYDDVMASQRDVIYSERKRILAGEDVRDQVEGFIDDVVKEYVLPATAGNPDDWDLDGLVRDLRAVYPVSLTADELIENVGGVSVLSSEYLVREFTSDARIRYEEVEKRIGPDIMRQVERQVVLQVIDAKWREHLYELDYLRSGIGLRAMGQRDPLMEYQRESFQMFEALSGAIKEMTLQLLFRLEKREQGPSAQGQSPVTADSAARTAAGAKALGPAPKAPASSSTGTGSPGAVNMSQMTFSGPSLDTTSGSTPTGETAPSRAAKRRAASKGGAAKGGPDAMGAPAAPKKAPVVKKPSDGITFPGTSRNAPCPCGSGKKYKLCHGKDET
ncbi:MAG: preprotein translocase subunit SecA [Demequinaceae bacterium]|nr:preprotein translocase subunit SecA [Demequinaceae bacterium]